MLLHGKPLRDLIWLVATPIARLTAARHIAASARLEGIPSISLAFSDLDEAALSHLRSAGLSVGAFAVLEDEEIERAISLRLPVFTTDRPDAALAIRRRLAILSGDVKG